MVLKADPRALQTHPAFGVENPIYQTPNTQCPSPRWANSQADPPGPPRPEEGAGGLRASETPLRTAPRPCISRPRFPACPAQPCSPAPPSGKTGELPKKVGPGPPLPRNPPGH